MTPLRNGVEIFPAMLEAIDDARSSIEFETFVYWSGDVARRMAEALARAADRGVEVRVILDAAGCLPMPDDVRETLTAAQVRVRDFGELSSWRFWQMDHRTHRKILVCDGRVGFTGGVGVAEEWEGDARNPDEWRETHFRIRGPAVSCLRGTFLEHWLGAYDGQDPDSGLLPETEAPPNEEGAAGRASVLTAASTAAGRWSTAQTLVRALVESARDSVRITTGYFVPEDGVLRLLCEAAARGVEVDIIHPGPHMDHRVSRLAGEARYPELLEAGVRIWRYQPTMIHAKIILVDDHLSCIGSANLNYRSLVKDDEVALVVLDRELNAALSRDFEQDREECRLVDSEDEWLDRPWWKRAGAWLASLVRREV
ncbi:MAG: phospholipase D-like domain-containing protein [Gemmatimonadota bacterium]